MKDCERPGSAQQHYELAVSLHRQDRLAEAECHYLAVRRIHPNHPGVLHGLGLIHLRKDEFEQAARNLEQASAIAPGNVAIKSDLGNAWLRLGRYEDALSVFEAVLAKSPTDTTALAGSGDALSILGRTAEARATFEKLIAIAPEIAVGHFGLGTTLMQIGEVGGAREAFERAIALAPKRAAYHRALAETARFKPDDPRHAALNALAAEEQNLPDGEKIELHFALAKAYDDLDRCDIAFEHLRKGNALKRRTIPYDEGAVQTFFDDLKAVFTADRLSARRNVGDVSDLPVFIVGMPRSGTTLVEQILASSPEVRAAGELTVMPTLISEGFAGADYPRGIAEFPDEAFARFGHEYVERLGRLAPGVTRVIDKLPANFRQIGLISLALPNARIIHIRRDPMDTCFSCYSKLFLNGLNYTYELSELGRYYRMYDALMAHWRGVLPDGAMLEVQYETFVNGFAKEARRIVEYCGLAWSDRYLSFYNNDRAVRTLSQSQVRQPLFTSSIGRWRRYAQWLAPLRDALAQTG